MGSRPTPIETATTTRSRLSAKETFDRVRIPLAATVPNIAIAAPPSTGCGMAAMISPSTGSRPSTTRIPPANATTYRLCTPVNPTSPTFCEKAVYGNVLNTPPRKVDSPSARSPSPSVRASTGLSTSSPTARMSPVVSVIVTSITTTIDTIAATSKIGNPKWNGVLMPRILASDTPEKSVNPNGIATTVPSTIPTSTAIRLSTGGANRCTTTTLSNTPPAKATLRGAPKLGAPTPPAAQFAATGSSDTPMIVITVPVTSGGKNRNSLPHNGDSTITSSPETITAP